MRSASPLGVRFELVLRSSGRLPIHVWRTDLTSRRGSRDHWRNAPSLQRRRPVPRRAGDRDKFGSSPSRYGCLRSRAVGAVLRTDGVSRRPVCRRPAAAEWDVSGFFLVPSRHRSFNHLGRTPLFEQTAPAVSTWVDAPMGPRPVSAMRTRIAAELRGSLSARIASGRRNGTGLGASLSVSGLLRRTEVSRGLRPGQNDGLLLSNPREALRRAYAYDLLHSR